MPAKCWLALCLFPSGLFAQPVDAVFVLETTLGTEQAIGLLSPRDLNKTDRAGVIGFSKTAQVLQELTENRDVLAKALRQAGTRVAVGLGGARIGSYNGTVDLGGAIRLACREFGSGESTRRKRALIVLFANEDPALGARLGSLQNAIRAAEARLFAVAVQRAPGPGPRGLSSYPFPAATAQILSQLAEESGGKVFRRNWDLKEILAGARTPGTRDR